MNQTKIRKVVVFIVPALFLLPSVIDNNLSKVPNRDDNLSPNPQFCISELMCPDTQKT